MSDRGVMMRIGTYDVADYPDRALRHVHSSRRHESIGYHIAPFGLFEEVDDVTNRVWERYRYRFTYRHLGRSLSVTWRCGTAYGEPKPWDGLSAVMLDANLIGYGEDLYDWGRGLGMPSDTAAECRKITRMWDLCVREGERLDRFLGDERENWQRALEKYQ